MITYGIVGIIAAVIIFIYQSMYTRDEFWKTFATAVVAGFIWPVFILNTIQMAIRGELF